MKWVTLFDKDEVNAIRSGGGRSMTKKHSWDMIKVKSATKEGFETDQHGARTLIKHI